MIILNAPQKSLQVPLMTTSSFMLGTFELGVFDIGAAVLAPVFRLAQSQFEVPIAELGIQHGGM